MWTVQWDSEGQPNKGCGTARDSPTGAVGQQGTAWQGLWDSKGQPNRGCGTARDTLSEAVGQQGPPCQAVHSRARPRPRPRPRHEQVKASTVALSAAPRDKGTRGATLAPRCPRSPQNAAQLSSARPGRAPHRGMGWQEPPAGVPACPARPQLPVLCWRQMRHLPAAPCTAPVAVSASRSGVCGPPPSGEGGPKARLTSLVVLAVGTGGFHGDAAARAPPAALADALPAVLAQRAPPVAIAQVRTAICEDKRTRWAQGIPPAALRPCYCADKKARPREGDTLGKWGSSSSRRKEKPYCCNTCFKNPLKVQTLSW